MIWSTAINKAITANDLVVSHFNSSIVVAGRDTTAVVVVDIVDTVHHLHYYLSVVTKTSVIQNFLILSRSLEMLTFDLTFKN